MSSIYRKGRDRYFYYQTYIYNDETGKKDKRIFHSLSTKDRNEAQRNRLNMTKNMSIIKFPMEISLLINFIF